jgi:hypothetical protein
MNKILRRRPKYKTVPDGTTDIEIWVAIDGKEFEGNAAEADCRRHDLEILTRNLWGSIEKYIPDPKSVDALGIDSWYHPKTEDELAVVLNQLDYNNSSGEDVYMNGTSRERAELPKAGDWLSGRREGSYIDIYTAEYLRNALAYLDKLK